jgi:NAD(P)-dependent dehydrogenase (short-subunit alcohol dehydrogenase family)
MAGRLEGEVAIVTGAGRGIGAAIARLFAREGAAVVAADRDGASARAVTAQISSAGGRALATETDVTEPAAVAAMAGAAADAFGRVSVLVNNAGIALFREPLALTDEEYRRLFAVDLDALWYCARAVLPGMRAARHGAIVNVASVHSFNIIKGCFPYPVAKHAVIGLTRALAIEYAAEGIRVNAICPGYVDTPLNRELFVAAGEDPAVGLARAAALHPPRRVATPEDVAWAALFLASAREAGFVNGASLLVDGGRSLVYHD